MKNSKTNVTAKSYTLRDDKDCWIGQVLISSDGAFTSITEYGNFNFAWRSTGIDDFRKFLLKIDEEYFATKMKTGVSDLGAIPNIREKCVFFTEMILPRLKNVLKNEIKKESK